MSRTRRRQPAARKPRRSRDSRTIPLWDETEQDNGTFYHCFWCKFTCNDKRDTLGDESTRNGVTHSDFTEIALGATPGEVGAGGASEYRDAGLLSATVMNSGTSLMAGGIGFVTPVVRSDSDGNPVEPVHYFNVSTSGGCPFCGCKNYRGDY